MRKIQRGSASQPERWMTEFADSLRREDLSATTVRGYLHDLTLFVRWYEQAIGEKLRLEKLTPIDLINYRQSLIKVQSNAVLVWNTIEIERVVERLRLAGEIVRDEDLGHISPLVHTHVIPNGIYVFSREGARE